MPSPRGPALMVGVGQESGPWNWKHAGVVRAPAPVAMGPQGGRGMGKVSVTLVYPEGGRLWRRGVQLPDDAPCHRVAAQLATMLNLPPSALANLNLPLSVLAPWPIIQR